MALRTIALDISGNFNEGKGTTGIAQRYEDDSIELSELSATDFKTAEDYWEQVGDLIVFGNPEAVVIEGYKLYAHKAKEQHWSDLETPQLLGYLKMVCHLHGFPCKIQYASEAKFKFSDTALRALGILDDKLRMDERATNTHKRDALRHLLYFEKYGFKKERKI